MKKPVILAYTVKPVWNDPPVERIPKIIFQLVKISFYHWVPCKLNLYGTITVSWHQVWSFQTGLTVHVLRRPEMQAPTTQLDVQDGKWSVGIHKSGRISLLRHQDKTHGFWASNNDWMHYIYDFLRTSIYEYGVCLLRVWALTRKIYGRVPNKCSPHIDRHPGEFSGLRRTFQRLFSHFCSILTSFHLFWGEYSITRCCRRTYLNRSIYSALYGSTL